VPCADCHQPSAWRPARITDRFQHARFGFALDGAHASATCASCHQSLDFKNTPSTCASCHKDVHLGELGAACSRCHGTRSFTERADLFRAHQQTRFPLEGPHAAVDCESCHPRAPAGGLTWLNRPTACEDCHAAALATLRNPDHRAAGFSTNCTACHQRDRWSGGRFDHGTTRFALAGAHATATCADCHANGVYRGHQQTCVACHEADFAAAITPPHAASGFPSDCTLCHAGPVTWKGASFDHAATRFALTGAHQAATCADCHADGAWQGRPMECLSCHRQAWDATTSPPHAAAGFSTTCTSCHGTTQWRGATWDHGGTQFPLTGAHVAATCASCHADQVFAGKPTTCVSCHQADYDRALTPNHAASGFPTTCSNCHGTGGWAGAQFDHSATRFPLTGGHAGITCMTCHADGVWRGRSLDCVSCHRDDYDRVTSPNHRTLAFPTDCTGCHATRAWPEVHFDHSRTTFPLTGAHLATSCAQCHGDGVYDGKPTTCVSCHRGSYDATRQPPHASLAFPTDCTSCHTTSGWPGGRYNHAATNFPLTGAHLPLSCAQCHGDGVYRGKPTTCLSCHQGDYDRTTNPNHRTAQFPTDCTTCHTTSGWPGAGFDHNRSQFPLTGAHVAVSCAECHGDGVYDGKPTACVSCHRGDYDRTTLPPHASLAFPDDCASCHTTTAWPGGKYNHAATNFPLTGAHLPLSCAQCHGDGVYRGKPSTCVSCHQSAYDGTTDPNHRTARFPTDCMACHTTTAWAGARFDHDSQWFPIYSGSHAGKWSTCSTCHTSSSNYAVFTCLSCHEHNQTSMDEKHQGRTGYRYESQACYSCHPRGTH
jgi:DnaJ-class molecular chaperone